MKKIDFNVQDWLEIENILNNGIIKFKNKKYIRIIKIIPINYNLKSDFEKQSILNSYKIFLKTCNFNIQILIQTNKENLQKNINNIKNNLKKENKNFLNIIGNNYIELINKLNSNKKSSTKDFYLIISNIQEKEKINEDIIIEELNEKYLKIKECLSRCGNSVINISNKNEVINILFSFLNSRMYFLQ